MLSIAAIGYKPEIAGKSAVVLCEHVLMKPEAVLIQSHMKFLQRTRAAELL
jgi:hypothetical protein